MKAAAGAARKPGGGRAPMRRAQPKAASHPVRRDGHERQADERGELFAKGRLGLGRNLSRAPAAGFVLPSSLGEPLPHDLRDDLEMAFGARFGAVRIHRDAPAQHAALAMRARAFASGADVYFAAGAYDPATAAGRTLIAHELTHVLQQTGRASSGGLLEAQPVHAAGEVQCDPDPAAVEEEQKRAFAGLVRGHRGGDDPTGDLDFEKAMKRASDLLKGRLAVDHSKPAFSKPFADAIGEFQKVKSAAGRSFIYDALKLLGWNEEAGQLVSRDDDFKLRTLGLVDEFRAFLHDDAGYGRPWLSAWLHHDLYKAYWPRAVLRGWRAFYLRPRYVPEADPALAAKLKALDEEAKEGQLKSPPKLRPEPYWMVWALIGELEDERVQEQLELRASIRDASGQRSYYETFREKLPVWRAEAVKLAQDESQPVHARVLADGKIPLIDEAIAFWAKAFESFAAWMGKFQSLESAAFTPEGALDLPKGDAAAKAMAPLRGSFIKAATALFESEKDDDGNAKFPAADEYQQRLDQFVKALTGTPFAATKTSGSKVWADHVDALVLPEATAATPNTERLAQLAILPLLVDRIMALALAYDAKKDQAAPHFDDLRRAHRFRLARLLVAFSRWLGWNELADETWDVTQNFETWADAGEARLLLVDDWEPDERRPIADMLTDFAGQGDDPLFEDTPFTVRVLVEWFRYDYHHRLRETLEDLLRVEPFLDARSKIDVGRIDQLRQTQKEVRQAMAATAEAEFAVKDQEASPFPLKIPQRFMVRDYELIAPKDAKVDFNGLIDQHEKTNKQLRRRAPFLAFPNDPSQGVFAWAVPPLDGLMATLAAIPSIADLVARRSGETDVAWLSRLSPVEVGPDGEVSPQEKKKVRLNAEDFKRLNAALLRWVEALGQHEEKQLPDLWRRLIILRRRWIAKALTPLIEQFAEHPYVSHGPLGESDKAMAVRLDTPRIISQAMRAFEGVARPMREVGAKAAGRTKEAEEAERAAMQRSVDVQMVLLTLTLSPSLLKLTPRIIDWDLKRHLYEYYQLTIDFIEDSEKLNSLKDGVGPDDEAAAYVYGPRSRLVEIAAAMKEFMTAVEEELKKSQTERGFRSENGKTIKPNAPSVQSEIEPSPKPGGANEWRLHQELDETGHLDPTTGVRYRLVKVFEQFEYHPQAGSAPLASLRKGAGGPFSPARVIITRGGEATEYEAPNLPDIALFRFSIDDREFDVKANDLAQLDDLTDVFVWRGIQLDLEASAYVFETIADWMITVASLFFPEVAIAEFIVSVAQMLAENEFEDLVDQLKNHPVEFAEHAVEKLEKNLFDPNHIWEFVLLGGQHSPFGALKSFLPKKKAKINPDPRRTKFGRIVAALRSLGARFMYALDRIRQYTQPPLRRAQGKIAMHPSLVWLLRRASNMVESVRDLIPTDKLEEATKGEGPTYLLGMQQALAGESLEAEFQARMSEMLEGIQKFELPGELVNRAAAIELILGFILDRFGKRGKILRMLLSTMPVPESWDKNAKGKGFTNALHFLSKLIDDLWVKGSAIDPNKIWVDKVMPVISRKFTEVRDDLVEGVYTSVNATLGALDLKPLAKPSPGDLPKTEVEPEELTPESEASLGPAPPTGGRMRLSPGGGERLGSGARAHYERQLGADLSHVRVHRNAASATRPVGAEAVTSGSHVFLRPGVSLGSPHGRRLMAHELTHVVQQTGPQGAGGFGGRAPTLGRPGMGLRFDAGREGVADQVASRLGGGRPVSPSLRSRIGSADGVQPSLLPSFAQKVLSKLSEANKTSDFTKDLVGGKDPEGYAEAKALSEQVFKTLKTGVNLEFETFLKDTVNGQNIAQLVQKYVTELTNKFPELERKRIAQLAQHPRKKSGPDDADTELNPKAFVQLLGDYIFASRHVAMAIDTDHAVKKVQKIKIFDINMGQVGGNAALWDLLMDSSFGKSAATEERKKEQREVRERLNSLGPQPKVWHASKFRFSDRFIDDYRDFVKTRALGSVPDVPPVKEYTEKTSTSAKGLSIGTHGALTGLKPGSYDRESHHTTQYLLVEFFGNLPEASQKAFPGDPDIYKPAGVEFTGAKVDRIAGMGGKKLEVSALNSKPSERGADMPAILLSARCHQRGELHVLREGRWEGGAGEKEWKGTKTQGYAIENVFNRSIDDPKLRPRDHEKDQTELKEAISDNPTAAKSAYYKAALATYKWMNDRMIPALREGLFREELAYYRGIAARNHADSADGTKLKSDWDLQEKHLEEVWNRAKAKNEDVMGAKNWRA